jgi:hypothetical protein
MQMEYSKVCKYERSDLSFINFECFNFRIPGSDFGFKSFKMHVNF